MAARVFGVTLVLLALAWYLTYRKPKTACEEGSACATKRVSKWNKATNYVRMLHHRHS